MRLHQLTETPITNFQTIGDFDQSASIPDASDRRAVTAKPLVKRIKKAWENTPHNFNLLFVNIEGMNRHRELGIVSKQAVELYIPEAAKHLHDDAINVLYTNNEGDEKASFTPWILAHRLGHGLLATNEQNGDVADRFKIFMNSMIDIVSDITDRNLEARTILMKQQTLLSPLLNHIGTMKSAKDNNIIRPGEFFHEIFAQYLITGEITTNPVDMDLVEEYIDLVYPGERTKIQINKAMFIRQSAKRSSVQMSNIALDYSVDKAKKTFDEALASAVGQTVII